MNYLLGYIVCSLIVWLLMHDYDTEYMTQQQADEELCYLVLMIMFSPLTMLGIIFILAEIPLLRVWNWVKRHLGEALRIVTLSVTLLWLSGCAGYKIAEDGSVDTWGVLRTLTVRNDYYESWKLKSHTISTDSTTKDTLLGLDTLLDSAVNTAAKLKP